MNTYTLTYILLLQKKALKYLIQKYDLASGQIQTEMEILLDLKTTFVKPNERLNFSVETGQLYSNNLSYSQAFFNDSLIFNTYKYGQLYIDTIWIPTQNLGLQKMNIKQYWYRSEFRTQSFTYNVIENE